MTKDTQIVRDFTGRIVGYIEAIFKEIKSLEIFIELFLENTTRKTMY